MKTKKVKILSSILALAILVCSLSAVSGFVTTAETNSGETELINSLKNAWQAMYTPTKIANLKTDKLVRNFSNPVDVSTAGLTFKSENKVDKTAVEYDDKNTGIIFQNSDAWGSFWFDNGANNRGPKYADVFNDNNYDALRVTFKTGTVTAPGKAYLFCTYSDSNSTESAKIDITAEDSNKTVMLDTKTLFGKKLSELLTKGQDSHGNDITLKIIKIGFSKDLAFEGAELSDLYALKYVTLPENSENFTALQWYNAAKDLDVSGYENTDDFNTALNNLKNYLSKNDPDFMASELKTAWQAMYEKNTVANIKTEIARNESASVDLSTIGISFTDTSNSETGYTFNKSQHDSAVGYSNFLIFNSLCWDQYAKAYKWFDKGVSDNSFNNAFSQNDDIILTVNTGTLTHTGKLRIILRYGSWNTINKEIEFNESNKEITISFKELFELKNLSDALLRPNASSPDPLSIVRIAFSSDLATESAKLYPLKTVKYATLPKNNEDFTPLQWYNEAKDLDVSGYENTDAFNTALNNLKNYLSENDAGFMVSELKESWSKLSKDVDIAKLKTDVLVNQTWGDNKKTPVGVGLKFNDNNTFDKSAYEASYVGGSYYLYGLVFSKKNSTGDNVFFDSNLNSTDNNSFNNAFSDDSLYFTFNPGTVKTAGRMWVILQYNDDGYNNVLYSPVEIAKTDSNTYKKIVINDLIFKKANDNSVIDHNHLSELLTYTNPANKEVSLYTMKVFFNPNFVTEGASISELKTVKTETVPIDTDNELISGKSLRVDTDFYEENVNDFVANKDRLYRYLMTGKILGNVNETDDIDICDLVALVKLGYENDGTYKLVADMNKDGYITESDKTELRSKILNQ